jgi:hypothetical protein
LFRSGAGVTEHAVVKRHPVQGLTSASRGNTGSDGGGSQPSLAQLLVPVSQQGTQLQPLPGGAGGGGGGGPAASAGAGDCQPGPGDGAPLVPDLSVLSLLPGNGRGNTAGGGQSFTATTRVLLPGGKDQPETVAAVEVHRDTNLYNLTVKTGTGTEVIHTTASHQFWDPYQHQWIASNKLSKGEHLLTANGTVAIADGGTTPKAHDGWMWDLTVPGNNDHDFYVAAGRTAVLVHNTYGDLCYGPYHRRPGPQTNEEMAAARNGQATELRGGVNRGSSFRSVDAHYGPLPEGKQGYEFYTSVKPSDSGVGGGITRWVEGTPGVTEISNDLVAIPIELGRVVLP